MLDLVAILYQVPMKFSYKLRLSALRSDATFEALMDFIISVHTISRNVIFQIGVANIPERKICCTYTHNES